ncbi:MAG: hypothetical protein IJ033_02230 [Clostridia bacterium]|nr:hypothetical protein [Clostridia bacterium]
MKDYYKYGYNKPIAPPFPPKVFDDAIKESVKVTKLKDRLDVTIPVGLSDGDEPFSFTVREIDDYSVEFRDGGRALSELAKKVDLATLEKRINEYCKREGRLSIKGGREVVLKAWAQGRYGLMWDFYDFIYFCSTIANFDLYPTSYNMAEFGREDIDE